VNLVHRDLFEVWRFILGVVCTVYATVVTVRSLWEWCVYFSGADRSTALMRRYVIVQLLRLSPGRFTWELAQIGFWLSVLIVLLRLH
jgi:hypothetical protein